MKLEPEEGFLLLLLNGEIADPALVKSLARKAKSVLCADGASRHAARLSLKPDVIIGDMDSHKGTSRGAALVCDFNPNVSDFEKSLEFILRQGRPNVCIAGALGGRLDHTLVNLSLIERYSRRLEITMVDRGFAKVLGPGGYRFGFRRGETITLLALGRASVSLFGVRYPLKKEILIPSSRGLSNQVMGPVRLSVYSGRVWLASCGA